MLSSDFEKRTDLASKVSMLEERSINLQGQLNRIETDLHHHCQDAEILLADINHSIRETSDTIQLKIADTIQPIRDDLIRYKTTVAVIGSILTTVGTVMALFSDRIFNFALRLFSM